MAEEKKESGGLMAAMPVTAVLAILASLFFTSSLPYQDERPSSRPLQTQYTAAQDVEARLWQDPFVAVDGTSESIEKDAKSLTPESNHLACDINAHGKERIYCDQVTDNKDITILAVTLSGGSYQEASEQRMRRRYAVLSALINQGFAPKDEQHIGYFKPDSGTSLQKKVPFEWWSLPAKGKERKLLLLWADESSLLDCPATKLKELLFEAHPKIQIPYAPPKSINYAVIGPNTSTILRDMLKEVEGKMSVAKDGICNEMAIKDKLEKINGQIVYFSAGATASDNKLLEGLQKVKTEKETVSNYFKSKGVKLYRTTATDNVMMIRLMEELKLRHVNKKDHVVILSEGDTFYGRAMPEAFNEKWDDLWQQDNNKTVYTYSYMRGLDGKLPDKGDKTASSVEKKSDNKDKSSADNLIELPEGQNQKDYLRRMAANIFDLHQSLKNSEDKNGSQKGIAAIGILGSDVHDKLMILEALRQHFPHTLFFTTDLDAIYSHPAKLPQTHNLLVVSSFDLKLRSELQDKIPPFRDSYQTAFFLATQMVLYEPSIPYNWDDVKLPPRLFEIGRSRPVPLPTKDDFSTDMNEKCAWTNWFACENNVQPRIITTPLLYGSLENRLMLVLLVIIIPPLVSWRVRKYVYHWIGFVLFLVFLVYLTDLWWNGYIKNDAKAEPFYWHEGISIWPSQLLRLSTLLFAALFWYWGYKQIETMQKAFQAVSSADHHKSVFALPTDPNTLDRWSVFFIGSWEETSDPDVNSNDLWKTYLGYYHQKLGFFPVSMLRVLGHVVAFFLGAFFLISLSGSPNVPARGDFALEMNKDIIIIAVLATIFLITWVVQNARLCERLITHLSEKPSQWNEIAKRWAIRKNKVPPECVDDWLDIQMVVCLTETMRRLIWGPMVCIALLVIARSPVIDDWGIPWGLAIVFITMLLYAISAEIYLQRGAKRARTKAIDQLSRKIRGLRKHLPPNEDIIKRIEIEIERINMLRKGAFRPWYEWPMLQSFGGLSTLVILLQYLEGVWGSGTF
ncbi:MAG: hypothetical protein CG439_367 [Methylococcaceae bacterium NSP1-2]|nr:hypothetical protein [Methylococcaceae bacterium]OYV20668.1 MAG: hypothetical protein CG439_367 [Methylococcaceae bacterium NSP1-2]